MDSEVRHETPKEGRRIYRQKRFDYSNKDVINRPNILRYNKTCWRSMEELISDVFLLIPLIGFASTSLSATAVWTQGVVWKTCRG